jgi:hypothetical protein
MVEIQNLTQRVRAADFVSDIKIVNFVFVSGFGFGI